MNKSGSQHGGAHDVSAQNTVALTDTGIGSMPGTLPATIRVAKAPRLARGRKEDDALPAQDNTAAGPDDTEQVSTAHPLLYADAGGDIQTDAAGGAAPLAEGASGTAAAAPAPYTPPAPVPAGFTMSAGAWGAIGGGVLLVGAAGGGGGGSGGSGVPQAPAAPTINAVASDNTINASEAANVTISGTSAPGSYISLNLAPTIPARAVTADGNGLWSYALTAADLTAMGEGDRTISVTAANSVGTSEPATLNVSIDTVIGATTINTVAGNDFINANEQSSSITGTCDSGSTVTLSIGGATRNATVSGTYWTYTLTPADIAAMDEGPETISATATDAAGNTSTTTRAISVNTSIRSTDIYEVATDDIINATERAGTVLITGASALGATVVLTIGGNTRTLHAADNNGFWSYTLTDADYTAMGTGTETLSVVGTDVAGNSSSGTRTITIDTTAPTVSSVAVTSATGAQNHYLNAGDVVTATVTMSEATTVTGTPRLALNVGGTTVYANYASGSGTNTLTFTYTILAGQTDANGIAIAANSLTLNGGTINDLGGNAATLTHGAVVDNANYMVDTAAPGTPTIATVAGDDYLNATETGSAITGTSEANATIALTLGAGNVHNVTANGSGAWTYTLVADDITTMGQGPETISATATDAAGNTSATPATHPFTIDTLAPTVTLSFTAISEDTETVGDWTTTDQTLTVSGSNSALGADEKVQVSVDGLVWADAAQDTGTTWSFVDPATHADSFTYYARVVDTAGNPGTPVTQAITIDTIVAPVL